MTTPTTLEPALLERRLADFMATEVLPNEDEWDRQLVMPAEGGWPAPPLLAELQSRARAAGLWNLFLPADEVPGALTNEQYAPLAEHMGWVPWAAEVFNCSAPDTGNMEVLLRYGTPAQRERWLTPLLDGTIRSAFLMTEPDVASSDATNIRTSIRRDGDDYVISGRKWFATGVLDSRCSVWIVMGVTDPAAPRHQQQSQILVTPDCQGIEIVRPLSVMGDHEAPHGHAEVHFHDVRVPAENLLLGEGRGFEIAQGRLGPGRIHHCMRVIGVAERAIEVMCRRLAQRSTFGVPLSRNAHWEQVVAESRIEIDTCRLLTLDTARRIDERGSQGARREIAEMKVAVPRMARRVVDRAIQACGAAGLSGEFRLPAMYSHARWVSIADGPDEVHNRTIARLEFARLAGG
jgi:acyl-CoA dehydrogenase